MHCRVSLNEVECQVRRRKLARPGKHGRRNVDAKRSTTLTCASGEVEGRRTTATADIYDALAFHDTGTVEQDCGDGFEDDIQCLLSGDPALPCRPVPIGGLIAIPFVHSRLVHHFPHRRWFVDASQEPHRHKARALQFLSCSEWQRQAQGFDRPGSKLHGERGGERCVSGQPAWPSPALGLMPTFPPGSSVQLTLPFSVASKSGALSALRCRHRIGSDKGGARSTRARGANPACKNASVKVAGRRDGHAARKDLDEGRGGGCSRMARASQR